MTAPNSNEERIAELTSVKGQHDNASDALGAAIAVLTDGYQSDQQEISDGVAAGLSAATAPYATKIQAVIDALQDENQPDDTTRLTNALALLT